MPAGRALPYRRLQSLIAVSLLLKIIRPTKGAAYLSRQIMYMFFRRAFLPVLLIALFVSCRSGRSAGTDDGQIDITFVQVNDVYEIAPLENGKVGGMARLATLKQQELAKNPNTFLVMSGDFLSPSVYGGLSYNGKRIRGAQMVDAMNAAGFDFVGFGNHEFDISEKELQERIDSSSFQWIASNAFEVVNRDTIPFHYSSTGQSFPKYLLRTVHDADGTTIKLGLISVVLPSNPAPFVHYEDPVQTAVNTYNLIKDSCDAIVAITHIAIADDKRLADALPGLAAILGGHEHDMRFVKENGVYITKAHANAKSAYVVKLHIDKNKHRVSNEPKLVYIDQQFPFEPKTQAVVQKWGNIVAANAGSLGFNTSAVVPYVGEPLEGRETYTRREETNLTRIIANAMLFAAPQADAAIYNSGSIRVDDVLNPPITQYDILRTLPFGGGIREMDIKGDLLLRVLQTGLTNKGGGGWLQWGNISYNDGTKQFSVKGQPIDPSKQYRIVTTDFLITGKEAKLDFFNGQNPGIVKMYPAVTTAGDPRGDIRLAVLRYLEHQK